MNQSIFYICSDYDFLFRGVSPSKRLIEESSDKSYAIYEISPLNCGMGMTIGNLFRRILLQTIEGTAIAIVKIKGVDHEFSTIPGMDVDVNQFVLNLQNVLIRTSNKITMLNLEVKKPGVVTAGMIYSADHDLTFSVLNPDLQLCSFSTTPDFEVNCEVVKGVGYVPATSFSKMLMKPGLIALDCDFSPVTNVKVEVSNIEIKVHEKECLRLHITTNGTISAKEAMDQALQKITEVVDISYDFSAKEKEKKSSIMSESKRQILHEPISELRYSHRALRHLNTLNVRCVGDLIKLTPTDLLNIPSCGQKTVEEIQDRLQKKYSLVLGEGIESDFSTPSSTTSDMDLVE